MTLMGQNTSPVWWKTPLASPSVRCCVINPKAKAGCWRASPSRAFQPSFSSPWWTINQIYTRTSHMHWTQRHKTPVNIILYCPSHTRRVLHRFLGGLRAPNWKSLEKKTNKNKERKFLQRRRRRSKVKRRRWKRRRRGGGGGEEAREEERKEEIWRRKRRKDEKEKKKEEEEEEIIRVFHIILFFFITGYSET